jgi:large subunit ribosomal protein L4
METTILNIQGSETGKCTVPENIFGQKPKKYLLHEVITAFLANNRQGSANTKTRSQVAGGGSKPWKQKGTGRARHGSIRSPIWKGGGVVFGPKPRDYSVNIGQKKKQTALIYALSMQFKDANIIVVDKFELAEAKTKELNEILKNLKAGIKPLLVTSTADEKLKFAGRNLKGFKYMPPQDLNAYDVLNGSKIIITQDSLDKLSARISQGVNK